MRVALVVQRYGLDVDGGSEAYARRLAELLVDQVDLTVVTTCARDYATWANAYPAGGDEIRGVPVLRFPVEQPRDPKAFNRISAEALARPADAELNRLWVLAQGPHSPALVDHLASVAYDVVVFVTYLYGTTTEALPLVGDRSVLVPTLHDDPPLRLSVFDEIFAAPRLLVFNTPEEQEVAARRFGAAAARGCVIGFGVDLPPPPADPARFRGELRLSSRYALYVGRLDASKGVLELVEHHARYRRTRRDGLDLVLVGRGPLRVRRRRWLHAAGFVPEERKHDAIAGAAVVVLPSPYESLSLAQLEAWSHGRPTLANAATPVLVGQSRRSGGGLWYGDADEYAAMLDFLARARPAADAIGRQGKRYVEVAHGWDAVRDAWLEALSDVAVGR